MNTNNSIAKSFGKRVEHRAYLVTKVLQNLSHIHYILDD